MEHRAAEIRAGLKHPVIDGDGHWMEPIPVFLEYLREVGGPEVGRSDASAVARKDAWYRATRRSASTIACAAPSGGA